MPGVHAQAESRQRAIPEALRVWAGQERVYDVLRGYGITARASFRQVTGPAYRRDFAAQCVPMRPYVGDDEAA